MRSYLPLIGAFLFAAGVVFAGPDAKTGKSGTAAKGCCPFTSAKSSDCPETKAKAATGDAKCGECPAGKAKPASTGKAAASAAGTVTFRCDDGKVKTINVAEYTKAGKYADYKGKRYYFACPSCAAEFKKDPAAYARTHTGFPIPSATKAKPKS